MRQFIFNANVTSESWSVEKLAVSIGKAVAIAERQLRRVPKFVDAERVTTLPISVPRRKTHRRTNEGCIFYNKENY
uniref:Phage protein n=1 Tax=Heterorhabditis bacteriophora TaxID=37862 RepID=A0A1I7WRU3_HETBA